MPRTDDRSRDDSIAIGDIIANIPPDELRELVAADELETYVEARLQDYDERDSTTADAVRDAREAARDTRDADDSYDPWAGVGAAYRPAERDYCDGDSA